MTIMMMTILKEVKENQTKYNSIEYPLWVQVKVLFGSGTGFNAGTLAVWCFLTLFCPFIVHRNINAHSRSLNGYYAYILHTQVGCKNGLIENGAPNIYTFMVFVAGKMK